jgi:phosphatidylinositol 4-kinase
VIGAKVVDHNLDKHLSKELRTLLILSCHRIQRTREIAFRLFDRLVTGFPSLMCDSLLVYSMLDILTLLQNACDGDVLDEARSSSPLHCLARYSNCLPFSTILSTFSTLRGAK